MSDPYKALVHLPPADLSDLDPRFAEATWEELLYYEDMGCR